MNSSIARIKIRPDIENFLCGDCRAALRSLEQSRAALVNSFLSCFGYLRTDYGCSERNELATSREQTCSRCSSDCVPTTVHRDQVWSRLTTSRSESTGNARLRKATLPAAGNKRSWFSRSSWERNTRRSAS